MSTPDITYNPNPNKSIPYSARTPADAKLGNQYVKDPTNPKFKGVDPARFGFPADKTVKAPTAAPKGGLMSFLSKGNFGAKIMATKAKN